MSHTATGLQYFYTSIWATHGGFTLPDEINRVDLLRSDQRRSLISNGIPPCAQQAVSTESLRRALIGSALQGYGPDIGKTSREINQELENMIRTQAGGRPMLVYVRSGFMSEELFCIPFLP
jgi:hypothetical protein